MKFVAIVVFSFLFFQKIVNGQVIGSSPSLTPAINSLSIAETSNGASSSGNCALSFSVLADGSMWGCLLSQCTQGSSTQCFTIDLTPVTSLPFIPVSVDAVYFPQMSSFNMVLVLSSANSNSVLFYAPQSSSQGPGSILLNPMTGQQLLGVMNYDFWNFYANGPPSFTLSADGSTLISQYNNSALTIFSLSYQFSSSSGSLTNYTYNQTFLNIFSDDGSNENMVLDLSFNNDLNRLAGVACSIDFSSSNACKLYLVLLKLDQETGEWSPTPQSGISVGTYSLSNSYKFCVQFSNSGNYITVGTAAQQGQTGFVVYSFETGGLVSGVLGFVGAKSPTSIPVPILFGSDLVFSPDDATLFVSHSTGVLSFNFSTILNKFVNSSSNPFQNHSVPIFGLPNPWVFRAEKWSMALPTTMCGNALDGCLSGIQMKMLSDSTLVLLTSLSPRTVLSDPTRGIRILIPSAISNDASASSQSVIPIFGGYFDGLKSSQCPMGSFGPFVNQAMGSFANFSYLPCQLCPVGTYANGTGFSSCLPCPPSSYCPVGAVAPIPWSLVNQITSPSYLVGQANFLATRMKSTFEDYIVTTMLFSFMDTPHITFILLCTCMSLFFLTLWMRRSKSWLAKHPKILEIRDKLFHWLISIDMGKEVVFDKQKQSLQDKGSIAGGIFTIFLVLICIFGFLFGVMAFSQYDANGPNTATIPPKHFPNMVRSITVYPMQGQPEPLNTFLAEYLQSLSISINFYLIGTNFDCLAACPDLTFTTTNCLDLGSSDLCMNSVQPVCSDIPDSSDYSGYPGCQVSLRLPAAYMYETATFSIQLPAQVSPANSASCTSSVCGTLPPATVQVIIAQVTGDTQQVNVPCDACAEGTAECDECAFTISPVNFAQAAVLSSNVNGTHYLHTAEFEWKGQYVVQYVQAQSLLNPESYAKNGSMSLYTNKRFFASTSAQTFNLMPQLSSSGNGGNISATLSIQFGDFFVFNRKERVLESSGFIFVLVLAILALIELMHFFEETYERAYEFIHAKMCNHEHQDHEGYTDVSDLGHKTVSMPPPSSQVELIAPSAEPSEIRQRGKSSSLEEHLLLKP